jgi:hypothetical protein
MIIPASVTPVVRSRAGQRSLPAITKFHGGMHVQLPGTISYDLTVFDPRGKKMYSRTGIAADVNFNARQVMAAPGVAMVRLRYADREIVVPLAL